jgi:hypothetical protein
MTIRELSSLVRSDLALVCSTHERRLLHKVLGGGPPEHPPPLPPWHRLRARCPPNLRSWLRQSLAPCHEILGTLVCIQTQRVQSG